MTRQDIIDVQLEAIFGSRFPYKIQRLIDVELNEGHWLEGYELAVSRDIICESDARKLLQLVLDQHPALVIDPVILRAPVKARLPQSLGAAMSWIVHRSGAYALTDSLRVARFDGSQMTWLSPRISYDGIEFDSLADNELSGRAWLLGPGDSPDAAFTFEFDTGRLTQGEAIQH